MAHWYDKSYTLRYKIQRDGRTIHAEHSHYPKTLEDAMRCARELTRDFHCDVRVIEPDGRAWTMHREQCVFCGDYRPTDAYGHCQVCVSGMARTNGD